MPLTIGTRLGPYEVLSAIGAGGMGEVYRAKDLRLGREVALKVLPEMFAGDADRIARFQREAQVLATLNHPNIAHIYGLETSGDVTALVMELVEGPTLAELIAGHGPPEAERVSARPRDSEVPARRRGWPLSRQGRFSEPRRSFSEGGGPGAPEGSRPTPESGRGLGGRPSGLGGGEAPRKLESDDALLIARQIAEALESAHEQGIIHRDLKPANIKVTPEGVVKVLDFGLAKLVEVGGTAGASGATTAARLAELSHSPTITTPAMTQAGMILGTAAYMAPEQAKGRPADKRCDVWAFGCVLYEMLTGRRAFEGEDVSDTLAAVLRGEPDWTALPSTTPAGVRKVLQRCLEKDRKKRLRDIGDASIFIDDFAAAVTAAEPPAAGSRRRTEVAWGLAGAVLAAAIAVAFAYRQPPAAVVPATRLSVLLPEGVILRNVGGQSSVVPSPDGRLLVFEAFRGGTPLLWVRALDSLVAQPLAGTENALYPFWSPDSRAIGFFAESAVKTVDAAGGRVRTVCAAGVLGHGAAWSRSGVIVFASSQARGLFSVPAAGGTPTLVIEPDQSRPSAFYRFPSFLPDGRFLFSVSPDNEIRLGSFGSTATTKVLDAESQAEFVSDHLLFARQGELFAQRFDVKSATLVGAPQSVLAQITIEGTGYAPFGASADGTLVYRVGTAVDSSQLTWFDRAGHSLGIVGPPGRYRNPMLSPDQTRVALEATVDGVSSGDIWLLELARGVLSRFTFDPGSDVMPVWSPDGRLIAFGSDRNGGSFSLYQKPANEATTEALISKSTVPQAVPYAWSPDGQFILHRYMNNGAFNTGVLPLSGDRKSTPFQPVPFNQIHATLSPDGRWIAYQSNEGGRFDVFVQTFPTPGGKQQVSTNGGFYPRWRSDGRELFYYSADSVLTAVPISRGSGLEIQPAVPLFRAQMLRGPSVSVGFRAQYDVTKDGQRFLINVPVEKDESHSIAVLLNWTAALGSGR